ncbi:hypothetical protein CPB83DRAFT_910600 [Crepidotus variabilis]|uniref:Uncharacterized protein n=1 Tax=Crepidotus variabilis TaxID=179855 RepID=A0A9P6E717_9AGAR|nr:hypothetical protein CPB83DRAFT_910600 [Crepidotus variabilis]
MHPRFVNPHLQPHSYTVTSRAEIYEETEVPSVSNDSDDIERLQTLIKETNPSLKHALRDGVKLRTAKRNKVDVEATGDENEGLVSFRLVSSQVTPSVLSLQLPPPPPPVTREPYVEDTEEEATLRRRRAEAAAVDASAIWDVQQTSKKQPHRASTVTPLPNQPLLTLQSLQRPRKTRPPVPPDQLAQYPYAPLSKNLNQPTTFISKVCDTVDIMLSGSESSTTSAKQRRRQKLKEAKKRSKIRPPPEFWRPDAAWQGPCQGYAYGYPSSFSVGYERWKYKPDNMRKAVWEEI